jgi:hypothetical protein
VEEEATNSAASCCVHASLYSCVSSIRIVSTLFARLETFCGEVSETAEDTQ